MQWQVTPATLIYLGAALVGAATVLVALGVRHLRLRAHRRDVGAA